MEKADKIEKIEGGVTAAQGFLAAGTAAGIKYKDRLDMAMLFCGTPCRVAGTFTSNLVKAAPVKWDQEIVRRGAARAVVVNAGIANACTGEEGMEVCRRTAERAGELLGIPAGEVLVASTGVIGMQIPMERIFDGVGAMAPRLSGDAAGGNIAAHAIMTTDTHEKEAAVRITLGGRTVTVGGMCKGCGMIHPNMCTMLSFVTTDAAISVELLAEALRDDVKDTYNMISVDGDTSTNDTCLVLANGLAGNREIAERDEDYALFCQALHVVNESLARQMAGDGEGATALFTVKVKGAATKDAARRAARSVVSSNLTKAAIFGHDANWGRILCAMGYSGAAFDPERVSLSIESAAGRVRLMEDGRALPFDEGEAAEILSAPEVTAVADLRQGTEEATAWGCDLTYDYVKINADYRS